MLDLKFFLKVGPRVRDRYREHIFDKALDVNGKKFKGYSSEYGEDKRANKFKRQASKYANSTAPVLTGDLLRDYSLVRTTSGGFQIGWTTFGRLVDSLNKRGRVLTSDKRPLPDKVANYLLDQAEDYGDTKLKNMFPKSKTIKIGKK
tara:strand:- start:455 stop:895 length:441 start_codon:yes stop_codon:yes gene_type:complete